MKFKKGDIVRFRGGGRIDWEVEMFHEEVPGWSRAYYSLVSGMSGRRVKGYENELKPWTPGA